MYRHSGTNVYYAIEDETEKEHKGHLYTMALERFYEEVDSAADGDELVSGGYIFFKQSATYADGARSTPAESFRSTTQVLEDADRISLSTASFLFSWFN